LPDLGCEWEQHDLAHYSSMSKTGLLSEAIFALIEAGDLRIRSPAFGEAVQHAGWQLRLVHPWGTCKDDHARKMQCILGLRFRINGWDT
jgi:hypothetical protein